MAAAAVAQKMTRRMITLDEAGARCASVVLVYGDWLSGTTATEIKLPRLGATGWTRKMLAAVNRQQSRHQRIVWLR